MPAYWVARSKINDPVEYKKYTDLVPGIIAKFGGKVLARGGRFQIMEGPDKFSRFIVIEFPDLGAGRRLFHVAGLRPRCSISPQRRRRSGDRDGGGDIAHFGRRPRQFPSSACRRNSRTVTENNVSPGGLTCCESLKPKHLRGSPAWR